ncbi:MAG: DUF89 family protein [Bacteroidetes bacterium]|nr:DUF89 family protein [Bacteroidota bacterium]
MQTYTDCLHCITRMLFDSIKLATDNKKLQEKIYYKMLKSLESYGTQKSPPEIFGELYKVIKEMSCSFDPYKKIKRKCNDLIANIENHIREKIEKSDNSLLTAIEFSIAGNIIDYGINSGLNIEEEIAKIIQKEDRKIAQESSQLFAFKDFKKTLKKSKNILFISDNAGEIVLDKLLCEELKKYDVNITLATRSLPILNDITQEEAIHYGLDKVVDNMILSGSYFPGTVLDKSDTAFLEKMKLADLIISKGQGNFETMFNEKFTKDLPLYFLFMPKCHVIVDEINRFFNGCKLHDILLIKGKFLNKKY